KIGIAKNKSPYNVSRFVAKPSISSKVSAGTGLSIDFKLLYIFLQFYYLSVLQLTILHIGSSLDGTVAL
ncbi:MAG: hypothetical protein KAR21_24340, partial [Spirochaetales bacterium]|nr:hypothetical protein [Spirochaetales bacterium]